MTPILRPRLNFGGLVVGTILGLFSLTPSLLPRAWVTQGVITGLAFVSGYGIGTALSALTRRWILPKEPSPAVKTVSWWSLCALGIIGPLLLSWQARTWQSELRRLVGLEPEPSQSRLYVLVLALTVAALVLIGARSIRALTRAVSSRLGPRVPPRVAGLIGSVIVLVVVIGFVQGVLLRATVSVLQSAYSTLDGTSFPESEKPATALRSGGPGSLSDWDDLGREGRRFISEATSLDELEQFGGPACCTEPIRVYVGLRGGPTPEARAKLAVAELDRTGGFDREVLVIATPTGSGHVNPFAMGAIEYIQGGDTAIVSMQYSYMPSWLSVLLDEERPGEMTRALWGAVEEHLASVPESQRPRVLGFGESLGSFGLERGLGSIEEMKSRSDGILLIGATYDNPVRQELTRTRLAGSPEWQPKPSVSDVFFAQRPVDLPSPPVPGGPPRVVYLLNASDPVTWWNFGLLVSEPDWSDDRPYAMDRSPAFRWRPVVTFWQVVGDLPGAGAVPAGHGHIYEYNTVNGWLAISTPAGWNSADTDGVRKALDAKFG